uniref:Putative inorganic phosphate cotransporter n=1 Tax=Diabrotica virgifera virgifera TaxID=50390 RepID=A0A6P7FS33_DIAVI
MTNTPTLDKPGLPRFGERHRQIFLLFSLAAVAIAMRVQLSVAIVAMNDPEASPNPSVPVYDWKNKSVILSSFFWGYIGLQLFAADWGRRYGSKRFLLGAMTINCTALALVPLLAEHFGSIGVMCSRVVQGLCQGFVYPSISNLLGRWTHISERSRLGSLTLSGAPFGTIMSLPVNGFIAASWLGWPYCFYIYSIAGYLWVIMFYFLGASTPAESKRISAAEREYIEKSTNIKGQKLTVPWKEIVKCRPFWALFLAQVGQIWGYNTLLTEMPNYMNKVMGFQMSSNGLLSALPYLTCFLMSFVFGFSADYTINKKYISRTTARKIFNGISGIGAGTSLLVLSFLPVSAVTLSVVMLVSAVGIQSAATAGYTLNHIDLSPNFSGTLQAICNSCGSGLSILAPLSVQFIVGDDETNKLKWRIVFIVAAMMYIVPSILFALFASGVRQKWDGSNDEEERKISEVRIKKVSVWSIMSV